MAHESSKLENMSFLVVEGNVHPLYPFIYSLKVPKQLPKTQRQILKKNHEDPTLLQPL